jgi:tetratricopeptide (TPR) repeat protein
MSSQGSSFPLQANSASLDAGWQIRAKIHPDILAFLRTKPKVADDFEVLSKVARLAYYGASFAVSKDASKDKLEIGQYGYEIADRARKLNPKRVEGHYWFAVNYGIYGTAKGVMASLGGAKDMKEALDQAIGIDPAFHFGGPHRIRGRLYFKLPGGFISFGDKKKALEDMKKAIEVAPNMRLNYMWLAEVQAKVENDAIALKTLEKTRELPAVAGDEEEAAYKRDIAALEKDLR